MNAVVGFTGHWGQGDTQKRNIVKETFRNITGQVPWAEIAKPKLGKDDSKSEK